MSARLKKNDTVIVRTGKDKGKEGTIIKVLSNNTAIVEGINVATNMSKLVLEQDRQA